MSTLKNFPKTLRLLKGFSFRTKTKKENDSKNELTNPRFEISKRRILSRKKQCRVHSCFKCIQKKMKNFLFKKGIVILAFESPIVNLKL